MSHALQHRLVDLGRRVENNSINTDELQEYIELLKLMKAVLETESMINRLDNYRETVNTY